MTFDCWNMIPRDCLWTSSLHLTFWKVSTRNFLRVKNEACESTRARSQVSFLSSCTRTYTDWICFRHRKLVLAAPSGNSWTDLGNGNKLCLNEYTSAGFRCNFRYEILTSKFETLCMIMKKGVISRVQISNIQSVVQLFVKILLS